MHLPPAAGRVTVTSVAPEPWPLRHLELRSPRLSLRPDDDDGLRELAALAARGIHPPQQMPFLHPWTDQPVDELVRGTLQHHWSVRAALGPNDWTVNFLVRHDGEVVGTQGLSGKDYAATREVSTGSSAVLLLAFDHLGAGTARSGAFIDNIASLAVSRKLGYRPDGTHTVASRGQRAVETRLLLTPEAFVRPQWTLRVEGLDGCRTLLGA
jgi:RimJ/RimL family protein N-acetyltransferase